MKKDFVRMMNEELISRNERRRTAIENVELFDTVRDDLVSEIREVLDNYGWDNGDGVEDIVDTWWKNKGRKFTEMFGVHPNYVRGKFMIVLKNEDFIGDVDVNKIYGFKEYIRHCLLEMNKADGGERAMYDTTNWNYIRINEETFNTISGIEMAYDLITSSPDGQIITKEIADKVNEFNPDLRANGGQKASRLIRKICVKYGIDKCEDFNRRYARFADAINPLNVKRHVVFSWNPIDYLLMSHGNSWASCHTIDKEDDEHGYSGMYCGGTLSYLLDSVSPIFYSVDESYEGNDYELQPKINRCMFHLSDDKDFFIQGRVYPQDNDGVNSEYKYIREIVQRIIAECWETPNYWQNVKGTEECGRLTTSVGAHYRDYLYYANCNVSYNKNIPDVKEKAKHIKIGHSGICVNCGRIHYNTNYITCDSCAPREYCCAGCGCALNEDERYYYDDQYYCEDCVTYCECCEEYYPNDLVSYVEGYGYVCEGCISNGNGFYTCEYCGEVFYYENYNAVIAEDGSAFCCEDCACNNGYIYVDGDGWYSEDEVEHCSECDEYVLKQNYDYEHNMCEECAAYLEDEEDDDELSEAV